MDLTVYVILLKIVQKSSIRHFIKIRVRSLTALILDCSIPTFCKT